MWNKDKSVFLSISACIFFTVVLTLAVFFSPTAIEFWFQRFRGWEADGEAMGNMLILFSACFYPSVPFAYITLYSLLKLLGNIRKDEVFTRQNVRYLRRISWCCITVSAITLVGGFFYLPFLFIFVCAAFVGLMLRVVKNVMQSATELKEENELTI